MQETSPEVWQQPYPEAIPPPPTVTAVPQRVPMPPRPRPSNGLVIGIVAAAAIMFLIGMILLQMRPLIKSPGYSGPDYENWLNMMRYIGFIGALLLDIGGFLMLLIGPYAAISRSDLPADVRRAMIGLSMAIGVAWLVGSFLFSSMALPTG